jgi:DNA-directed RNA polymerase specialized sigma24 family protein
MLLEAHFILIERRLQALSRRSRLPAHQADDFCSWALFKLVEDDYKVLARWEGRSSFSTYLTVVLVHLLQDFRTHLWGKWRASAAARRQGDRAVLLERLTRQCRAGANRCPSPSSAQATLAR